MRRVSRLLVAVLMLSLLSFGRFALADAGTVAVNGSPVTFSHSGPMAVSDGEGTQWLVPLQPVAAALGARVSGAGASVSVALGTATATFAAGSQIATINTVPVWMPVAARQAGGELLVPASTLAHALGAGFSADGDGVSLVTRDPGAVALLQKTLALSKTANLDMRLQLGLRVSSDLLPQPIRMSMGMDSRMRHGDQLMTLTVGMPELPDMPQGMPQTVTMHVALRQGRMYMQDPTGKWTKLNGPALPGADITDLTNLDPAKTAATVRYGEPQNLGGNTYAQVLVGLDPTILSDAMSKLTGAATGGQPGLSMEMKFTQLEATYLIDPDSGMPASMTMTINGVMHMTFTIGPDKGPTRSTTIRFQADATATYTPNDAPIEWPSALSGL